MQIGIERILSAMGWPTLRNMKEMVKFLEVQPAPDFLKMIEFPDINEEDRKNILGGNAARLLKLKGG